MGEWSELPGELVELISKHLGDSEINLLRFRSVCSSWRSFSVRQSSSNQSSSSFPILPNDGISTTGSTSTWGFFLSKRSIFLLQLPHPSIPYPPWLLKLDHHDRPPKSRLLHPLSRDPLSFPLPSLDFSSFRVSQLASEYTLHYINYRPFANSIADAGTLYSEKVAFSNPPHHDAADAAPFLVLTIHVSGRLALLRSGDKKWAILDDMPSPYDDVLSFQGHFYAVDSTGRAVVVDVVGLTVELVADSVFGGDKKVLVDLGGELYMVDKYLSGCPDDDFGYDEGFEFYEDFDCYMSERTVRFEVFRLDCTSGSGEKMWIKVESLGGRILFLGDNCTFSASLSDFGCEGCFKGNCILFTNSNKVEDGVLKSRGIGVFDMESGSIGPLANYPCFADLFWPPPAWVASPVNSLEAGMNQLSM